jgi:hypothetical protein
VVAKEWLRRHRSAGAMGSVRKMWRQTGVAGNSRTVTVVRWSRGAAPERGTSREQDATAAEEPSAVTLGREEAMRGAEEQEAASIPLRAPVKSTRPP